MAERILALPSRKQCLKAVAEQEKQAESIARLRRTEEKQPWRKRLQVAALLADNKKNDSKNLVRCYNCDKEEHWSNECGKPPVQCLTCGRKRYLAKYCKRNKKIESGRNTRYTTQLVTSLSVELILLMTPMFSETKPLEEKLTVVAKTLSQSLLGIVDEKKEERTTEVPPAIESTGRTLQEEFFSPIQEDTPKSTNIETIKPSDIIVRRKDLPTQLTPEYTTKKPVPTQDEDGLIHAVATLLKISDDLTKVDTSIILKVIKGIIRSAEEVNGTVWHILY